MCGIAGLIHPAASRLIGEMVTAQRHRGPDAEGTWHGPGISLGHNRLSIIDLSDAGRQPMLAMDDGHTAVSDADAPADRVVAALVFNGEIYNYRELRDEIAAAGQMFRSDSDTEVLLHGLRRHGPAFLQRCVGMFALALFEPRTGVLLLARDRMGKKPLAVARVMIDGEPGIAFASELSAFSALARALPDGAGLAIDPTAVLGYLLNDYVPPPRTILRHCWRVPAGHRLELPIDRLRELPMDGPLPTTAWWRRVFTPKHALSKADAEAQYEELFTDAVRMRLRSDVPLGVFLSGGIDSSLVVATTRKLLPGPLHTFNLRFREASFDESPWARTVAQHFDTVHHETELSVDDLFLDVPAMLDHMDEPFADHSLLPTRAVSRMARQQVTVVLGGDGADEPFAGYAPFGAWPIARWLAVA
ncbi:MAG: asparagine synthase (glutamine-hydrolyzing), partial [Planctomycetota bacterium]